MQHSHTMGGSTCERRIMCPGSLNAEKQMPEGRTSHYAVMGTVLHSAMQFILENDCGPDQVLGKDFGESKKYPYLSEHDFRITEAHVDEKIVPALDAFDRLCEKHGIADFLIEQKLSLAEHVPGAFGTADLLGVNESGTKLLSLDWKFGDGIAVSPKQSFQGGFYAAAALYDPSPIVKHFTEKVKDVVIAVVQPTPSAVEVEHEWVTDVDWIEQLIDQCIRAVKDANRDDAPFIAGKWCKWCKAQPICPAYDVVAESALKIVPDDRLSPVAVAAALEKADLLEEWCRSVRRLGHESATSGTPVPGWKLVKRQGHWRWADAQAAEARLRLGRVKVGDMFTKKLVSPAQLRKKHPRLAAKMEKTYMERPVTGTNLVRADAPGEAITDSFKQVADMLPSQE